MLGTPLLPLAIALGGVCADASGAHRVAFYLVLLAIPAAAGAALAAAGDLVDGRHALGRMVCTACALVLLIVSSSARYNAAPGGSVPAIAISALVGCVLAYGTLGLLWLVRPPKPAAARLRPVSERS
jgi:hypothetical protein